MLGLEIFVKGFRSDFKGRGIKSKGAHSQNRQKKNAWEQTTSAGQNSWFLFQALLRCSQTSEL